MQHPSSLLVLDHEYDKALRFFEAHPTFEYGAFDQYILDELKLFDVPEDATLRSIKDTIDKIMAALPAIKRIFAKPIVHLKDVYELSPIEAVRYINNYTLAHTSVHSELWASVDSDGVRPKKLMTLEKIENYAIYENLVFTRTIDLILDFVKKTLAFLREVMYSCRDLQFNLLDHTHHNSYFLAIGKLHSEYATARSSKGPLLAECVEKLTYIEKVLRPQLSRPVYKACKGKKKRLTLKKTNTFRSHKDYKKLYKLLSDLNIETISVKDHSYDHAALQEAYHAYGILLTLFAAAHFNFSTSAASKISFEDFDAQLQFLDWTMEVKTVKVKNVVGLNFILKKNRTHTICVIWSEKQTVTAQSFEAFKEEALADEYLFANSYGISREDSIRISLYDIDSFRRIQQLILKGMIYADETHDQCPFCGNPLARRSGGYECEACNARIEEKTCATFNERYYVSDIVRRRSMLHQNKERAERERFLHDRISEARLHFRNITPLDATGELLCPKCGKVHP